MSKWEEATFDYEGPVLSWDVERLIGDFASHPTLTHLKWFESRNAST